MSYTPASGHIYSPQPQTPQYYSSTPPAPPPKPSGNSTPARGPPLPPPPPQNEPSELDGNQTYGYQSQQTQLPPIPAIEQNWLPGSLKDKNTSDLHILLQEQALQAALLDNPITTHSAIPASQQALRPIIDSNLSLARSLQQTESHLNDLRSKTQSRLLALKALEQQHRSKLSETEDALSSFSPMALYQQLSGSVQEQESLLRGLEESWFEDDGMASEREVGDFVRRVKDARKTAFLRRERKERWDEGRVGGWR